MNRLILASLILVAGCGLPCHEKAALIGPSTFESAHLYCDEGSTVSYQETPQGLMMLCACPAEPTP